MITKEREPILNLYMLIKQPKDQLISFHDILNSKPLNVYIN